MVTHYLVTALPAAPTAFVATEPAAVVMPIAVAPAEAAAPELTPPGISQEATSGTKRMMYAPTSIPMAYMQLEPMPCKPKAPICDHELTEPCRRWL